MFLLDCFVTLFLAVTGKKAPFAPSLRAQRGNPAVYRSN
jgi:hypothetical protein